MASAANQTDREWLWGLGAILLLGILWWTSRKPTSSPAAPPAAVSVPPPAPAPTPPVDLASTGSTILDPAPVTGSNLTMEGYAQGDVSDASLAALGPDSIAMLNRHTYYSGMGGPVNLYDWYADATKNGLDTTAARAQIQQVITNYVANPAGGGF